MGELQRQLLGIPDAAPPAHYAPPQPPPPAAAAQPQAAAGADVNIGVTPTQAFESYVPVSAKAQNEAARDYMASEAMRKMGRKGVAKRVPTWLMSTGLE